MQVLNARRHARTAGSEADSRFRFLTYGFAAVATLMIVRLGYFQIAQYGLYSLYASDQHELAAKLLPTRGQILVRDRMDGTLHPLATNRLSWQVYAVPKDMIDPVAAAHAISVVLDISEADLVAKLTKRKDDPYELIRKDVDSETVEKLRALQLEGIGYLQTSARLYPEERIGGQLVGFVFEDPEKGVRGQYGIEGAFDKVLAGTPGEITAEKDAGGRRLAFAGSDLTQAVNGSDVVLTIDRTVQYKACDLIQRAMNKHDADGGSLVVMDPGTGAIVAMCSAPDFSPSEYGKVKDLSVLNNPVTFMAYEPGSVFKAITMAAGLDTGKISPKTTYVDNGVERIDDFDIKNSDLKAHGVQTMAEALAESLNTATIYVERLVGKETFRKYVESFGFGKKTGVELTPESKGNVQSLAKKGSIFAATASFGQGITVTPIQLLSAYAALGNGGKLMKPYIVEEVIKPDGTRMRTKPEEIGTPISTRTSRLITGMLVNVVENGHGKRAGVPGYWVAGKTGTAQVPKTDGLGYQKDVTIGSFVGYAPANDPKFVMLVKIDHPRDVQWAESSAAPLFGEMAAFLLTYEQVPPERVVGRSPVPSPAVTSTAATTTVK